MEKVIQHNASASEEMSSTTEELSGQSEQLVAALAFFRTGGDGRALADHARPALHADAEPSWNAIAKGITETEKRNGAGKTGVGLKLREMGGDLDAEFERY